METWDMADHLIAFIVGPMITVVIIFILAQLYEKYCDWDNNRSK